MTDRSDALEKIKQAVRDYAFTYVIPADEVYLEIFNLEQPDEAPNEKLAEAWQRGWDDCEETVTVGFQANPYKLQKRGV